MDRFIRTTTLIGKENQSILEKSRVLVLGVGGVGGFVIEALTRCGVGRIDIVDGDVVSKSNINRQIIALSSTVGQKKTAVMKERMLDINPDIKCNAYDFFFLPENSSEIDFSLYDYIVDAVDTVTAKVEIVVKAIKAGVKVISCMGTGNKLDPTQFKIADIYQTSVCPLCKIMRNLLRKKI